MDETRPTQTDCCPRHSAVRTRLWRLQLVHSEVLYQMHRRKNSDYFIEFLEHIMQTVPPEQKVILVLDNASYHRSYASLAALALFEERLRVLWLPKYCPFLNPIERFWLLLMSLAAANHLHHDLDDLRRAIAHVIQQQALPDSSERLFFAHNFRPLALLHAKLIQTRIRHVCNVRHPSPY
jgi:transposase